jgi:hypothetical protein
MQRLNTAPVSLASRSFAAVKSKPEKFYCDKFARTAPLSPSK